MSPFVIAVGIAGMTAASIVFIFLNAGLFLIWAMFLGWASLAATGNDKNALLVNIASNTLGGAVAWMLAFLALSNPMPSVPFSLWVAVMTFVCVVAYVSASKIRLFSSITASSIGFAGTFGYIAQTPGGFSLDALTAPALSNALVLAPISMAIGSLFAFACNKATGMAITRLAPH